MALSADTIKALLTAGGAGLDAIGQAGSASADRKVQKNLAYTNALQTEAARQTNMGNSTAAALGGPYEQANELNRMLIKRQLLGGAQNVDIQAPAHLQGHVGQISGGMRIPEGGLDVRALSDPALAETARTFYGALGQANPYADLPNLGTLGLGDVGAAASANVAQRQGDFRTTDQARQQAILAQLDPQSQQNKGGGFWNGFGKVLKVAAPIAASFIPGVGPILGAAIAAGGSAGGDLLSGGDWKSALISGALSAGSGYGVGKVIPKIPTSRGVFKLPADALANWKQE